MPKILITGGHLTPALAFIDYCQASHPDAFTFVFAGRQWAQKKDGQLSWEKTEISKRRVKFVNFKAVKTGSFNLGAFSQSFQQASRLLQQEEISLVLSFGGYLALPFALAAKTLHIPVITHEQTQVLGRANRFIAAFADRLAVSFPDTTPLFRRKTVVTGNPLRPAIFASQQKSPAWFTVSLAGRHLPLLYISGGSQGSQTINQHLLPLLADLSQRFLIIHQVGRASLQRQPLHFIQQFLHTSAGAKINSKHYFPREFISEDELAFFYPRLDFAIARSGANTVAELAAFAVPTLFIPLPFANYHEQEKNALALVKKNAASILLQPDLDAATLAEQIHLLEKNAALYRQNLQTFTHSHQHAAANLYQLVTQVLAFRSLQL